MRRAAARRLRLRVGPAGVDVVLPARRTARDVPDFLRLNANWVLDQLRRMEALRRAWLAQRKNSEILFRGEPTPVRVESAPTGARQHAVAFCDGQIVIRCASACRTPTGRSLENWLRCLARAEIEKHLEPVCKAIRHEPARIYIRDQRTRWGSCSSRKNLSFNWRLILAPEFVLRYLVIHEAVHMAVPNHSAQFWARVRALCPEADQAKLWLRRNGPSLMLELPWEADKLIAGALL